MRATKTTTTKRKVRRHRNPNHTTPPHSTRTLAAMAGRGHTYGQLPSLEAWCWLTAHESWSTTQRRNAGLQLCCACEGVWDGGVSRRAWTVPKSLQQQRGMNSGGNGERIVWSCGRGGGGWVAHGRDIAGAWRRERWRSRKAGYTVSRPRQATITAPTGPDELRRRLDGRLGPLFGLLGFRRRRLAFFTPFMEKQNQVWGTSKIALRNVPREDQKIENCTKSKVLWQTTLFGLSNKP